jgi:hypothetical protein
VVVTPAFASEALLLGQLSPILRRETLMQRAPRALA